MGGFEGKKQGIRVYREWIDPAMARQIGRLVLYAWTCHERDEHKRV
jgi:hypothetical protein